MPRRKFDLLDDPDPEVRREAARINGIIAKIKAERDKKEAAEEAERRDVYRYLNRMEAKRQKKELLLEKQKEHEKQKEQRELALDLILEKQKQQAELAAVTTRQSEVTLEFEKQKQRDIDYLTWRRCQSNDKQLPELTRAQSTESTQSTEFTQSTESIQSADINDIDHA